MTEFNFILVSCLTGVLTALHFHWLLTTDNYSNYSIEDICTVLVTLLKMRNGFVCYFSMEADFDAVDDDDEPLDEVQEAEVSVSFMIGWFNI